MSRATLQTQSETSIIDIVDASLSLGTEENGVSRRNLTQKDTIVFTNVEEKLEAHNEWWHTAMLLMANIVGGGILGLPGAFARIGWCFDILLLIVIYLM